MPVMITQERMDFLKRKQALEMDQAGAEAALDWEQQRQEHREAQASGLEQLTADIALAIQEGTCKWTSSSESEPRFTAEVAAPTQINVIDQDGQEYTLVVSRKE